MNLTSIGIVLLLIFVFFQKLKGGEKKSKGKDDKGKKDSKK